MSRSWTRTLENSGAGIEILKRAGVEVSLGLLADLALKDLAPYLMTKLVKV